ncbi:MAG TPA: MarR family transcriptional regulator [Anaerolineaceae bacterium]|nr:MarR family transcriptional regulator [Anaerolineaceae bacterium]
MDISSEYLAHEILDVVPIIMRTIRREMRSHRGPDLSVPQYRAMNFIRNHPGASLSGVADHVGLTLPSTSKLVDGLVGRGLVIRQESELDRRRVDLKLTQQGDSILVAAYQHTQACLARMLTGLSPGDREEVIAAMGVLRPVFSPVTEEAAPGEEHE